MLDKYQIKAVKTKKRNVLVIAGAGSGKTYTIINRVNYLLNNGVDPKDILCISFTNEAVNNLKKELNNINIDVFTFHKLALKIIGRKKEILSENMLYDIVMDTFNNDTLFGLYKISKESMYDLICSFINMFKSNNFDFSYFNTIMNRASKVDKMLIREIMKCFLCYESYLNKEGLMDFNDMINDAIVKLKRTNVRYKYIIIDEYQDISYTKYLLIKELQKLSNSYIFAVGDDYQSIYRFAGSNIMLFTRFRRYFRFAKIYKLKYTYRNSKQLIKIASKFIMKNSKQISKKMKSNININNPIVIVYYDNLNCSVNKIIDNYNINDLLILGRNNIDIENIKIRSMVDFKKMTVHKSKGLQSENVFLVNISNSYNGFPNKIKDNKILKYVNKYKEYYPYEEERRLFYVALTRCKKRVFLFVPKGNESIFIKEIKKYNNKR